MNFHVFSQVTSTIGELSSSRRSSLHAGSQNEGPPQQQQHEGPQQQQHNEGSQQHPNFLSTPVIGGIGGSRSGSLSSAVTSDILTVSTQPFTEQSNSRTNSISSVNPDSRLIDVIDVVEVEDENLSHSQSRSRSDSGSYSSHSSYTGSRTPPTPHSSHSPTAHSPLTHSATAHSPLTHSPTAVSPIRNITEVVVAIRPSMVPSAGLLSPEHPVNNSCNSSSGQPLSGVTLAVFSRSAAQKYSEQNHGIIL